MTVATSASDRYVAARKAIATLTERMTVTRLGRMAMHEMNADLRAIQSAHAALRALVEPESAPGIVDTRETQAIRIIFDGPPEHEAGRFVEVENEHGAGVKVGRWFDRGDGYWALAMTIVKEPSA
jgi:hypothetical protein